MLQEISSHHFRDDAGHPAGGTTQATGLSIIWQNGPLGRPPNRREPNGAFVETVLEAARDRLLFYEHSEFSCPENRLAILNIERALQALNERTRRRESECVEGTHVLGSAERRTLEAHAQ